MTLPYEKAEEHRRAAAAQSFARRFLQPFWREADRRHADVDTGNPASIARWQELHARDREERLYFLVKKAVFWGVTASLSLFTALYVALWIVLAIWRPWDR